MSATVGQTWVSGWRLSFNGAKGGKIIKSLAALLVDKSIDWGQAAVTAGWPFHLDGTAGEATALALIGNARGYIADPSATTTTTATNLQNAQVFARFSGTPIGLLVALYNAGLTGAILVQQNGLAYQITGTPTATDFANLSTLTAVPSWVTLTALTNTNPRLPATPDGHTAAAALTIPWWVLDATGLDASGNQYTSRFAVLFNATLTPDPVLGTAANLARLQAVLRAWKPAKSRCVGVYVCTGGAYVGWPQRVVGPGGTLVGAGAGGIPSVVTSFAGVT